MGGGAVMRAAAKVAGIGLQNAGVRGGQPENFVARKSVRPSASVISSTASVDDTGKLEITAASQVPPALTWELDDWDLAGFEQEKPRLVFGPTPSIEETKEATSELRDALDKLYFPPSKSAGSSGSVSVDEHTVVSKSEPSFPSVPNQALQAFKFLRESSAAQTVVASIAADPSVWNAVLQNDELQKYLQSEKNCMESEQQDPLESSADSSGKRDAGKSGNFFVDLFKDVKLVVVGWVSNMSCFFQDLFGGQDVKTASGPANRTPSSTMVSGTFFGLAVMVIMVVVLKRV